MSDGSQDEHFSLLPPMTASALGQGLLQDLWHESFTQISHVHKYFEVLLDDDIDRMPWNIRRAFDQVHAYCSDLFLHVASVLCRGVMVPDKAVSFHAKAVRCFNRASAPGAAIRACFPVGPHRGHFLGRSVCTSVRMDDSLGPSHDQRASGGVRPRRVGLLRDG